MPEVLTASAALKEDSNHLRISRFAGSAMTGSFERISLKFAATSKNGVIL